MPGSTNSYYYHKQKYHHPSAHLWEGLQVIILLRFQPYLCILMAFTQNQMVYRETYAYIHIGREYQSLCRKAMPK